MSYEELTALYPKLRDFSVHIYETRALCQHLLVQQMLEKKATKVQSNGITLTLKVDPQREINYALLEEQLQPLIPEEEWFKVVSYEPKISWFHLKQLKKIGGKVLEIIERAVRENEKYFLSVSHRNGVPRIPKEKIYDAEEVGAK